MEIKTIMQTPHDDCTGCAACLNICPVDAISMQFDANGFLSPNIDTQKCVECGKCAAICPVLPRNNTERSSREPQCYASWSKDEGIRFNSTSGGIFTHLAQAVLDMGGAVVGARYREDNLVEHALIRGKDEIEMLRQSKYVQSEIGMVIRQVKSELTSEKPVLFAGTPCQCAGLRAYLGKDDPNLYLCDFICRGVNSPLIYKAYLRELEERYGSKIKQVWFKNKTFGWNKFATKIVFENGEEYLADRETDPFMLGYIKSKTTLYMRPSCYQCRFKGISRPTDITLADFWGVEKRFPEVDVKNGVSAVMVHSEKGEMLFELVNEHICRLKADINDILKSNKCLVESAAPGPQRKEFQAQFHEKSKSFSEMINLYYLGGNVN